MTVKLFILRDQILPEISILLLSVSCLRKEEAIRSWRKPTSEMYYIKVECDRAHVILLSSSWLISNAEEYSMDEYMKSCSIVGLRRKLASRYMHIRDLLHRINFWVRTRRNNAAWNAYNGLLAVMGFWRPLSIRLFKFSSNIWRQRPTLALSCKRLIWLLQQQLWHKPVSTSSDW